MADNPFEAPADPAKAFRELRDESPVHRFEAEGEAFFTVSRHEDVRWMFGDARAWSAKYGQGPARTVEPGIRNDGAEHTLYRRLLNRVLAKEAVAPRAGDIRAEAERAIDALPADGGDLLDDLTGVVPLRAFAPVLGLDAGETRGLWRHTFEVLFTRRTAPAGTVAPWEETRSSPPWQAAYALVAPRLAERRGAGARSPDLLGVMAEARDEAGAPLPGETLVHVVMLVLFGAVHTAATLLTNAVLRLLERRGLWAALCRDPSLAAAVVEESARFDTPVAGIFRTAAGEQCLHGVRVPDGAKARGLFAAANRDPAAFADPDAFRLDRDPAEASRHLSFGFGVHTCAGAPFARLEGPIILETLARRRPDLRLAGEPRWWRERDAITLLERHGLAPVAWGDRRP